MYADTALYQKLTDGSFPVIVSLARHDLDLAKAALDGGAYALKTHLNAYHRATGTTFGSFADERAFFEELAKLGVPLLVMAGQETVPTAEEMELDRHGRTQPEAALSARVTHCEIEHERLRATELVHDDHTQMGQCPVVDLEGIADACTVDELAHRGLLLFRYRAVGIWRTAHRCAMR